MQVCITLLHLSDYLELQIRTSLDFPAGGIDAVGDEDRTDPASVGTPSDVERIKAACTGECHAWGSSFPFLLHV